MKKILIFLFTSFLTGKTFSQKMKIPEYLGDMAAGIITGKNDSSFKEKNIQLKGEFVYGMFFGQLKYIGPIKKGENPGLDKMLMVSMGIGKNGTFNETTDFAVAVGPNMTVTPDTGYKKNLIFWGGTVYGKVISEESGLDAEISATYSTLPKNHEYDWKRNLFVFESKLKKFFGSEKFRIGIGFEYKLRTHSENEPHLLNSTNYYGMIITNNKSEFAGLFCINSKNFGIEIGPVFPRVKYRYRDKTGADFYTANNQKMLWHFGIIYDFSYRRN